MRRPRPLAAITCTLVAVVAMTCVAGASAASGGASGGGGGGGGGGGAACSGFALGGALSMRDSCFAGTAHVVEPGARSLEVRNDGQLPHTLTAVDGSFDLRLEPGARGSIDLPGDRVVLVYCTLHGSAAGTGMAGAIVTDPTVASEAGSGAAIHAAGAPGGLTSGDEGVPWAPVVAVSVMLMGAVVLGVARLSRGARPTSHPPRA